MTRAAWRKALGSPGVGAQLPRPVRATLFVLAEAMTADGRLSVAEEILTNRAQVSWRTLARHRREAAEAGWLLQSQRGCLGRIACYQAALPTEMGANPGSQQDRDGCQPPPNPPDPSPGRMGVTGWHAQKSTVRAAASP